MRRLIFIVLCLPLFVFLSNCTAQRYVIVESSSVSLKEYRFLEIKNFESSIEEDLAHKITDTLPGTIVNELYSYNLMHPSSQLLSPARSTEEIDRVLILEGTLISHNNKKQGKKHFLGLGKEKVSYTVQCTFKDKKTGKTILQSDFEAESGGFLGENVEETAGDVASGIVYYLEKHS